MAVRDIVQAAAGVGGAEYQIERSLRFNSADSAYLSRTPASTTDRTKWSLSLWVKRSALGSVQTLLGARINGDNYFRFGFNASDQLNVDGYYASTQRVLLTTTPVYRDVSSFYHILIVGNTPDATSSNRFKVYVNGVQVTAFGTATYPSQNAIISPVNETSVVHEIGRYPLAVEYFNGYLTEINFVDGQALTPSDFGETDATTGVWKPKAYAGTYGTNGFYLNFSDNSSTTTLGYDAAGSNDWTPNNFSVTAGAGNDSLVDTPTPYGDDTGAGGEVRGNYCTLNPLSTIGETLSNGNLYQVGSTALARGSRGTIAVSSGKWYYEFNATVTTNTWGVGWIGVTSSYNGGGVSGIGVIFYDDGNKQINGSSSAYGSSWSTEIIGVALDLDSLEATFYINGVSQGTITGITADTYYPGGVTNAPGDAGFFNFGQRPFTYTAPSGFKALCTQNLPTPTVVQGGDYFNTVLYTGNGFATAGTQTISGVGFQPDFVWIKSRSAASSNHSLYDAVRTAGNTLVSNSTAAETTQTDSLTAFTSDGFSLGDNSESGANVNVDAATYVAWNWNAGGSNATNTDGTITSTVRANTTAGFSIVSYTGNGSTSPYPTVGHGLGVTPKLIITKTRSTTSNWVVYTTVIDGSLDFLYLNTTAAKANSALPSAPTSTVFQVGGADNNTNGATVIAYCFAEVEGFSKFGSYTGNGNDDGPFVYCGFRPAFVLYKDTNAANNWEIIDAERSNFNVADDRLFPSNSSAESTSVYPMDLLSNGFKLRDVYAGSNTSGINYIFMAFAENPFKYSLAR